MLVRVIDVEAEAIRRLCVRRILYRVDLESYLLLTHIAVNAYDPVSIIAAIVGVLIQEEPNVILAAEVILIDINGLRQCDCKVAVRLVDSRQDKCHSHIGELANRL